MNIIIIRDLTDIKDHIKWLEHQIKKDSVTFRYEINEMMIKTLFRLINEKYHPMIVITQKEAIII